MDQYQEHDEVAKAADCVTSIFRIVQKTSRKFGSDLRVGHKSNYFSWHQTTHRDLSERISLFIVIDM